MLVDILRFNARARRDLSEGTVGDDTMADYVRRHRLGEALVRWYLVPMGAAIWSMDPGRMLDFPACTYLRFFENHGLLTLFDQPTWHVVKGGSFAYVKAFLAKFRGTLHTEAAVQGVRRTSTGVELRLAGQAPHSFDRVVIATHADEALAMLEDPTPDERRLLGAWRYSRNATILHTDASLLPPLRRAWASWNYRLETGAKARSRRRLSMTYHMNRLQRLATREQYCVTLNTARDIPDHRILRTINYTHPIYTAEAIATQDDLPRLNALGGTYFVGNYHRYGFHEDAVWSAVRVARAFGIGWETPLD
jgi:predicted NAD/FAD-binding protein